MSAETHRTRTRKFRRLAFFANRGRNCAEAHSIDAKLLHARPERRKERHQPVSALFRMAQSVVDEMRLTPSAT